MRKTRLVLSIVVALIAIAGAFASAFTDDSNALVLAAYRDTSCNPCDTGQTLSDLCDEPSGERCTCLFQNNPVNAFQKPSPTSDCVEAYRPRD